MSSEPKASYRIPKIPVRVEINLGGRGIRPIEIYVAEHLARAFRRQHVADLLAGPEAFLPARDLGDDRFAMFNKAVAIWIRIPLASGSLPVEESSVALTDELFEQQHPVEIELASGERLCGDLMYSLPAERARPVDYLNEVHRFCRLWTSDYLYLVNKDSVVWIVEGGS